MQGKGARGLSGLQEKWGGLCQEEGSGAVSFDGRGQPQDRLDVDKEKEIWYRETGKGELFLREEKMGSPGREAEGRELCVGADVLREVCPHGAEGAVQVHHHPHLSLHHQHGTPLVSRCVSAG